MAGMEEYLVPLKYRPNVIWQGSQRCCLCMATQFLPHSMPLSKNQFFVLFVLLALFKYVKNLSTISSSHSFLLSFPLIGDVQCTGSRIRKKQFLDNVFVFDVFLNIP